MHKILFLSFYDLLILARTHLIAIKIIALVICLFPLLGYLGNHAQKTISDTSPADQPHGPTVSFDAHCADATATMITEHYDFSLKDHNSEIVAKCQGNNITLTYRNDTALKYLAKKGFLTADHPDLSVRVNKQVDATLTPSNTSLVNMLSRAYFPFALLVFSISISATRLLVYEDRISLRSDELIGSTYSPQAYFISKAITTAIYALLAVFALALLAISLASYLIYVAYYDSALVRESFSVFLASSSPTFFDIYAQALSLVIFTYFIPLLFSIFCISIPVSILLASYFYFSPAPERFFFYRPFVIFLLCAIPLISLGVQHPEDIAFIPFLNLSLLLPHLDTALAPRIYFSNMLFICIFIILYVLYAAHRIKQLQK